jgi:hypothetical protein
MGSAGKALSLPLCPVRALGRRTGFGYSSGAGPGGAKNTVSTDDRRGKDQRIGLTGAMTGARRAGRRGMNRNVPPSVRDLETHRISPPPVSPPPSHSPPASGLAKRWSVLRCSGGPSLCAGEDDPAAPHSLPAPRPPKRGSPRIRGQSGPVPAPIWQNGERRGDCRETPLQR